MEFHKIPFNDSRVVAGGRTEDRQTDVVKLMGTVLQLQVLEPFWNYLSFEPFQVEKPLVLVGSPNTQSHSKSVHHTGYRWQTAAAVRTLHSTFRNTNAFGKHTHEYKWTLTHATTNTSDSELPTEYSHRARSSFYRATPTGHVVHRHASVPHCLLFPKIDI
jgi:hypothetical protein